MGYWGRVLYKSIGSTVSRVKGGQKNCNIDIINIHNDSAYRKLYNY